MKPHTLVTLLALAAQGLAIPARLKADDVTSVNTTPSEVPRPILKKNYGNYTSVTNISSAVSIPTTLVTSSTASSTSSSAVASLVPRRPHPTNRRNGFWNVVYFASWSDISILDTMPWESISHVVYAFAKIEKDGTVVSANPAVDETMVLKFNQIKRKHRHVKVLLSIGGYAYSQAPESQFNGATDIDFRHKFAHSAVKMMLNWGFDGIDVDWEYPTKEYVKEFTLLIMGVRELLEHIHNAAGEQWFRYLLTIATGVNLDNYIGLDWFNTDESLDAWFLMAYDYTGSWSKQSGHHANLNGDTKSESVEITTTEVLMKYFALGAWPEKMVLGIPLYGHSFIQPENTFGSNFTQPRGTDTILYKDIDIDGDCGTDYDLVAAWCHDGERLISFDNIETVQLKTRWAVNGYLGGVMFWQAEGDKLGRYSLITAAKKEMPTMDGSWNQLEYPDSHIMEIAGHKEA